MHQLFVYGTLRKGGVSHHLLKGAAVLKEGVWLRGYSLYSAGWYPLAVNDKSGKIIGDVVELPDSIWPELDAYEGESYDRLYLEEEGVWIYVYKLSPKGFSRIESGDWLSWWKQG
ncbi:gamma-glutamylcyclotransferase [Cesiribacter sp. SM1]|uniref:gamma-glutamylcyclotransferase family protein n=1 Tax=Cesiribacter sp. SM1 TaxID=2861196 RepID=UPI001CD763F1|nr:gamma-glutamylcyclotransferase family protein [Cesiribacter sp. SM1]